jgi:hypothetical protein
MRCADKLANNSVRTASRCTLIAQLCTALSCNSHMLCLRAGCKSLLRLPAELSRKQHVPLHTDPAIDALPALLDSVETERARRYRAGVS